MELGKDEHVWSSRPPLSPHPVLYTSPSSPLVTYKVSKTADPVGRAAYGGVCGGSLAWMAGSNPAGGTDVCCEFVCYQVEVSATGRSLVQRSPTECVCMCVIECDQVQQ